MNAASESTLSPPVPAVAVWRDWLLSGLRGVLGAFDRYFGTRNVTRWLAILIVYCGALAASFHGAYELRWDFMTPEAFDLQRATLLLPVVVCKLLLLQSFGQFRSVLSYFGLADFGAVVLAMLTVSGIMLALWFGSSVVATPPRGVIMMDFALSVGLITGFRLALRIVRIWSLAKPFGSVGANARRVVIVGAGDVGEALAKDLLHRRGSGLEPLFFLDDDAARIGRSIHGLPVYGPIESLVHLAPGVRVHQLIITLARPSPRRVKEIVEIGRQVGATTEIVPSFTQLASGEVKVHRFRPVAIEDLLGRPAVNLDSPEVLTLIRGRVVLVTGAGGSIGSELCRQILRYEPRELIMLDQTEIALFEIEQELVGSDLNLRIRPIIGDITDESAMRAVFTRHRPNIIFHAAAHKHVPLMERQPAEALKNNSLATASLTRLASAYGVERFVLISTDKAINPTSVMGCSKRLAEKALQAQQRAPENLTAFLAVRFGNVLGSSGSVIPTFKRQIEQGGPLTVTHPDMTRYFMTIPEAVGLVLQAAALGSGGEIFILDMGRPVKIMDLARQMIELSGYRVDVDIEIKVTGLRPGEKLFEELRHTEESHEPTAHKRIFKLRSDAVPVDLAQWLDEIRAAANAELPQASKQAMKRLVPEYIPYLD